MSFYDPCFKNIIITFSKAGVPYRLSNEEISGENFEFRESLCSNDQLTFGTCEASEITFRVLDIPYSLLGADLSVSIENDIGNRTEIGKFRVVSDKPDTDKNTRTVVAYDALYDVLMADVKDWYNSLYPSKGTTHTIAEIRHSFCNHVGLTEEDKTLVNDGVVVGKTIDPQKLNGKSVLTAICEINGVFGHIGRDGTLEYVTLEKSESGIYPGDDVFPADNLYPAGTSMVNITSDIRFSANCEDYETRPIDKVQIRTEEGDIGVVVGSGDNAYVIQGNFLLFGKSSSQLAIIASNFLDAVKHITYRPCKIRAVGNPDAYLGRAIITAGKHAIIQSYILKRELTGVQSLRDTYTAEGALEYSEKVDSIHEAIIQLEGKANILTRTLEETRSEIYDENGRSKIAQTAHSIEMSVSKGVSTCGITIRLKNADGETIDTETGDIQMTGMVTFNALSQAGQTVINGSNIKTGTIDASLLSVSVPDSDDITLITNSVLATTNVVAKNLVVYSANVLGDLVANSLNAPGFSADSSGVSIAGFDVDSYRIKTPNSEVSTSNPGLAIQKSGSGTYAFAIGFTTYTSYGNAPFRVTHAGKLYASNAEISGKITASSGSVGGWTINTASLTNGLATLTSGKLEITNNEGGNNTVINYEGVTADTIKPTKIRCTFEGTSRDLTPIAVTIGSSRYVIYGQKL